MATAKSWLVLPAYQWTLIQKDAMLMDQLKSVYNKPSRSLSVSLFTWPVRKLLADVFSMPGREKATQRQGTNILEMSAIVRDPKQAAVNIVFLKCQELFKSEGTLRLEDEQERRIVRDWINSWLSHKSNPTKCELLYNEMITKRSREAELVRERRSSVEKIVREAMGPNAAEPQTESSIEPIAVSPSRSAAATAATSPMTTGGKHPPAKKAVNIARQKLNVTEHYPSSDEDETDDVKDRVNSKTAVEEDSTTTAMDELRIAHSNLCRLEEIVDLEKKGSLHFAKSLGKFSRSLIYAYLISVLLCTISGDGWEIMINFFAAGVLGIWGITVSLKADRVSITLFTITVLVVALFLYPLHIILRATVFNNDPDAAFNGLVIASTVIIELMLFLTAVYATSLLGIAQRVKSTLKMLLPTPVPTLKK